MGDTTQVLFLEVGPGILRPVEARYTATTSDGEEHPVTHHVLYHVWGETEGDDRCADRIEELFNDSRAWMGVGIRWVRTLDREQADVRVEFHATKTWKGSALYTTVRTHFSGGRVLYTIKLIEARALQKREGVFHEGQHILRAYHMDKAWPDYPYVGVMSGDGTATDRWPTEHDLRGMRNYKRGQGKTAP